MRAERPDRIRGARVDARDNVLRMRAGGAAGLDGRGRQTDGDRIALRADRLEGLFAAGVDAANDIVSMRAECA